VTNIQNHERTAFVKYVVPMFKYFSQETNLIEFSWCERAVEAQELAGLQSNDYYVSGDMERRFADGLGKNVITKNEEVFMESSSGFDKENISHTLDDTIKLIVECSNALHYIIKKNKKASIDSITLRATFGLQIIKQTITLTKMNLKKSDKWKLIELRSSVIPTSWNVRYSWVSLFELLATLFVSCYTCYI
jgi:hypothetical protein